MKKVSNLTILKNHIEKCNAFLKFSAEWCGPCRHLSQMIIDNNIEKMYPNIEFIEIDVDEVSDETIFSEFKVKNIPALFCVKNGEITKTHVGTLTLDNLKEMLNNSFV